MTDNIADNQQSQSNKQDNNHFVERIPIISENDDQLTIRQNRINVEIDKLETLLGAYVEKFQRKGKQGLPTGEILVLLTVTYISGKFLSFNFVCGPGFPSTPPTFRLLVNGCDRIYESSTLQNWSDNYLYDIVEEVISAGGLK